MDDQSIRPPSLTGSSETSRTGEIVHAQGEIPRHATTIGMLTDNVLLDIFDIYRKRYFQVYYFHPIWPWHVLVHVCQRWRQIIFESPHRLKLQILCTHKTPTRRSLEIWPALPIIINYGSLGQDTPPDDEEGNINAALEHPDRVCRIRLSASVTDSQLAKIVTVMQEPFPELTYLDIGQSKFDVEAPVLPGNFLGGSAPRLQELLIYGIPYPALPTLLSSTNDLVTLRLAIHPRDRISSEAMVMCLAGLPKLEALDIKFQPFSSPDRIRLPPKTPIVLPALTSFIFMGTSEDLEDLVSQMDGPRLKRIIISYYNRDVAVPVTGFPTFVDRSIGPKLTLFNHAVFRLFFSLTLSYFRPGAVDVISFDSPGQEASDIAELLGRISATEILLNVIHLHLDSDTHPAVIAHDIEWLHLLRRFSAVQSLQVSQENAKGVALALEDITGEMVTEVLPSLNLICLEGLSASAVGKFVAARELSGRPVTIVDTVAEFGKRLEPSICKTQLEALFRAHTVSEWSRDKLKGSPIRF